MINIARDDGNAAKGRARNRLKTFKSFARVFRWRDLDGPTNIQYTESFSTCPVVCVYIYIFIVKVASAERKLIFITLSVRISRFSHFPDKAHSVSSSVFTKINYTYRLNRLRVRTARWTITMVSFRVLYDIRVGCAAVIYTFFFCFLIKIIDFLYGT